jgi:hypothetical protein
VAFCGESIVAVSEFKYLYFEVWVVCEGWLHVGGAPKMHNISGLSQVGHLHFGR